MVKNNPQAATMLPWHSFQFFQMLIFVRLETNERKFRRRFKQSKLIFEIFLFCERGGTRCAIERFVFKISRAKKRFNKVSTFQFVLETTKSYFILTVQNQSEESRLLEFSQTGLWTRKRWYVSLFLTTEFVSQEASLVLWIIFNDDDRWTRSP